MSEADKSAPAGNPVTAPESASGAPAPGAAKGSPGKKPPLSEARRRENRRRFIRSALLASGVVGFSLLAYVPVVSAKGRRLRPPGALEEADFLASCIKCGQCVQVCPVQAIKLGDIVDGFGIGVPHIDARAQACDFSCDAVQCVLACPTGALVYSDKREPFLKMRDGVKLPDKPILKAKEKDADPRLEIRERIGVARLARPDACLAVQGKGLKGVARDGDFKGRMRYMDVDRWKPIRIQDHPYDLELCDLCVRECPIKDAIKLEPLAEGGGKRMVPKVLEGCVGCGVCEMICPVAPAAIVVDAQAEWKKS
jgi:ferredoxin-type protein NapG